MFTVKESLRDISSEIASAAIEYGRDPQSIELMAVTKTRNRDEVEEAYRCGVRLFGENRVQEAVNKFDADRDDMRLHLIGHLQRNKAKDAAVFFDEIESIDKITTIEALVKYRTMNRTNNQAVTDVPNDRSMEVLLEMNTSGEDSKSGVPDRDALFRLAEAILARGDVSINGLMTIGPFSPDEMLVRKAFAKLREALVSLRGTFELHGATTLSMGMSSDFRWAIAEGSTRVRIGTALFGSRDT